jgi:hypothetical protein
MKKLADGFKELPAARSGDRRIAFFSGLPAGRGSRAFPTGDPAQRQRGPSGTRLKIAPQLTI